MQSPPPRTPLTLTLCSLLACAADRPPTTTPAEPSTDPTFEAQVARGQNLYGQHCADCHGADGSGGSAPAVVGQDALQRFDTAAEVFAFTDANMPGHAPGSLPTEDTLAILAFDLHANGIDLDEPLTPANAGTIRLSPE